MRGRNWPKHGLKLARPPWKGKSVLNAKKKGKVGEEEACRWLEKHLFDNQRSLKPNTAQSFVGADIVANPFIFEVKRRETLSLNGWWVQIHRVYKRLLEYDRPHIPVVMYRINRGEWYFLISASAIGDDAGWVMISSARFIKWAKRYL